MKPEPKLQIAKYFANGAVAVFVPDCGGSYDLYANDDCEEHLGNVCSLSEAERFLARL